MKCISYWKDRKKKYLEFSEEDHSLRGKYLLSQWVNFIRYFKFIQPLICEELGGLKYWIFSTALYDFQEVEYSDSDYETLLNIGRCFKKLGDYQAAITRFELALKKERNSAVVMAELADSYLMINEEKKGKVFLREAFFTDPKSVELDYLESPILSKIIDKIIEKEYDVSELNYWIPVFATVFGVFNVKRELKPIELGRIKQMVYDLEHTELTAQPILILKLINHYFWLIDHYLLAPDVNENRNRVEEILLRIKKLNSFIYEEYTK